MHRTRTRFFNAASESLGAFVLRGPGAASPRSGRLDAGGPLGAQHPAHGSKPCRRPA